MNRSPHSARTGRRTGWSSIQARSPRPRYRGGAFIPFHGGFDRAPLPNEGYKVTFVPMGVDGLPSGPAEVFADRFAGSSGPLPTNAVRRPVGVTVGPDGSPYISDDRGGRSWRVIYKP